MYKTSIFCTIISLTTLITISSCSDDDSINRNINPTNIISSNFFFQYVDENSDTTTFQEGIAGVVNSYGKSSTQIDTAGNILHRQSTSFNGTSAKATVFFMEIFNREPNDQNIQDMFQVGVYPFGNSQANPPVEGVEIVLIDDNNIEWSTAKGMQDTSATFILSAHSANDVDSFTPFKSEGTFSGWLFNDNGDTLTVNYARFIGRTVVFN